MNEAQIRYCRSLSEEEINRLPFRNQVFENTSNAVLAKQAGLQKLAARKLPPDWLEKNILIPDRQALEQCSSALTAAWKKTMLPRHIHVMADACAGLGVDAIFLAEGIPELQLYENHPDRAEALRFNAGKIRSAKTLIQEAKLEEEQLRRLAAIGSGFLLYADPDRRDAGGSRMRSWESCQPDVRLFYRILKNSGARLLAKFSPLEDPEELANEFPGLSRAVLLSVHNEVKEVVLFWDFGAELLTPVFEAVDLKNTGEARQVRIPVELKGIPKKASPMPGYFLLDPLAGLRKGRFAACLAEEQGWMQLSARARLYTSSVKPENFPGRVFQIEAVFDSLSVFAKSFQSKSCHVVSRDFPIDAEEIRKKLGFREEGSAFLFCYTDPAGKRVFLLVERI
jgi:hypothetical protein